ncbi:Na(+)/H(+) antiporter subunit F [bacterium HR29]|jgi:multicomponent Na+:H+ antiporter subunit F|nr:Na(+)/H(+) antiporter subunit F [bacterium HR29]
MNPNPVESAALTMLAISATLAVWRLLRGPSLPDRVLAVDTLATIGLAFIAVQAMVAGRAEIIDVGIAMALIVGLATVAFAHFLERSIRPPGEEGEDGR